MQLGLQLPDTTSPPPPSFRPVTEYPPPSPPTTPMRSHENSNEQGLISESIQRQVATVEQTMNEGMEGLADSVSQVTSTSFDTPFSSTPMTTGWKSGLMRSYRTIHHVDRKVERVVCVDTISLDLISIL